MKECWNCLRQLEDPDPVCEMCGAAVPVVNTGPAVAAAPPDPPPERVSEAPGRAREPYVPRINSLFRSAETGDAAGRARARYTLSEPASIQERASETAGFYAERAATQLGRARLVLQAMQDNAPAALLLLACTATVVYMAVMGIKQDELGFMDAPSVAQSMRSGLFLRQAVPTSETVAWNGRTITIEEAWIGQAGRYQYASMFTQDTIVVPSGRYRLYFKTSSKGGTGTHQFFAGAQRTPVGTLELESGGAPLVLHYVDLPGFVAPPQTITVLDPSRAGAGSTQFTLH